MNAELADIKLNGFANVIRDHGGVKSHWLIIVMSALVTNPDDLKIMEEGFIDSWMWADLNNLPSPLHSQFLTQLEIYTKHVAD
jgi:hypothetical protein